jgi:hypothetical protein
MEIREDSLANDNPIDDVIMGVGTVSQWAYKTMSD